MIAASSSCTKDSQLAAPIAIDQDVSSLESRDGNNSIIIDPILSTAKMATRKAYLNGIGESLYPTTADISEFVWDVEYFVNKDNWAAHPGSDLMMVFETVTFDIPHPENDASSYTSTTLESIRAAIAVQAATRQITTDQSIFRKVFRIANVSVEIPSSPNGPAVLSIQIGGGIQEGPCPDGANCPPEVLGPADVGVLIVNYTDCDAPPERLSLSSDETNIEPPCDSSNPALLDLAKSYVNKVTYDNTGLRLPDGCNELPASLLSQAGAPANVIEKPIAHYEVWNQNYDNSSCHGESFLYNPTYCNNSCNEDLVYCTSTTARDWVLGSVDDAVVLYHTDFLDPSYKWFCASDYYAWRLTSNCGLGFSAWVDGMWVVE